MSWPHGRALSWGDSETWGLRGSIVRRPVAKQSPWEPWQVEVVRKEVLCGGGKRCRRESEEDTPKWREWSWVMLRRVERSPNQIPKLAMGVSSCRHVSTVSSQEGLPYPVLVWGFPWDSLSLLSLSIHPWGHKKIVSQPKDPCSNTGPGNSKLDLTWFLSFSSVKWVIGKMLMPPEIQFIPPRAWRFPALCPYGFIQGSMREGM